MGKNTYFALICPKCATIVKGLESEGIELFLKLLIAGCSYLGNIQCPTLSCAKKLCLHLQFFVQDNLDLSSSVLTVMLGS